MRSTPVLKKYLAALLLLFPTFLAAHVKDGQERIDSLLYEVSGKAEDSNKVMLLADVSYDYRLINADKGLKLGRQGLDLATRIKWEKGMAMCHYSIGVNYAYVPDNTKAFESYIQCLNIYEKLGDKKGMAKGNVVIGNVYDYYKDYDKAIGYYSKALKLYEALGSKWDIARCCAAIGEMYAGKGDAVRALEHLSRSIKVNEEIGNKREAARTTGIVGTVYTSQKNYLAALDYGQRAVKMSNESGAEYYEATNLCNIAVCYLSMLKDTSAAARATMKQLFGNGAGSEAAVRHKASELLQKALAIAIKIRSLDVRYTSYLHLIELLRADGNYKKALEYTDIFLGISDTLYSKERENKVSRMAIKNEFDRRHAADSVEALQKVEASATQLQKQRNFTYIGVIGVVALLGFSFFIAKERSKSERERKKSEALAVALQDLLLQKDVLMKEIHHRVKNNLTVIGTLLDLQLENISDVQASNAMTEAMTRVKSISLIHQQLYTSEDITSVELSGFAKDLTYQVTSIFMQRGQKVTLKNDIPKTSLDIDTAVPLGLILNELLTNSFKYAFPGNCDGDITIALSPVDEQFELTYKDSGPGLPVDIKEGLGTMVIQSLSKQLGGTFVYDRSNKTFVITFKDITGRKKTA